MIDTSPPFETVTYPEFPDYEKAVRESEVQPIFANDLNSESREGQTILNSLLYTRYNGNSMSSVPLCSCGELMGGYQKGMVCEKCHTRCLDNLDKGIISNLWVYTPDGIEKFITPGFWNNLSRAVTKSDWNLLEWFVNPGYANPPEKHILSKVIESMELPQKQRNLNFFYHNFEALWRTYLTKLLLRRKPKGVPGMEPEEVAKLYADMWDGRLDGLTALTQTNLGHKYPEDRRLALFLEKYIGEKERVFSKYLPLPSGLGVILESNATGTWMDVNLTSAANAMYSITQMSMSLTPVKPYVKNRRCVQATKMMAEYGLNYVSKSAGGKFGDFRRHVYGGRLSFTLRAVIIGNHGQAGQEGDCGKHNELLLPWTPTINLLRPMVLNKLRRKGFTPKRANRFIDDYTNRHHHLMAEILNGLIIEDPNGIWVTHQRPPSLKKPSIQLMRVRGVCEDPNILAILMSPNATNGPNADFDGDFMQVWLVPDRKTLGRLQNLAPHRSVLDVRSPRQLSNSFTQQAPQVLTMYNYLYGEQLREVQRKARED